MVVYETFTLDKLIDKLRSMKEIGIPGDTVIYFSSTECEEDCFCVRYESKDDNLNLSHKDRILIEGGI